VTFGGRSPQNMSGYSKNIAEGYSAIRGKIATTERDTFRVFRSIGIKDKVILDFGCGDGFYSIKLIQEGAKKVIGIDASSTMIELAKKKYPHERVAYINADGKSLPLPDYSFDIVFANFVIQHFKESHRPIKEIHRVLKDDGYLLLALPIYKIRKSELVNTEISIILGSSIGKPVIVHNFIKTKNEIDSELVEAGFTIKEFKEISEPEAIIDSSYPHTNEIESVKAAIYLAQK